MPEWHGAFPRPPGLTHPPIVVARSPVLHCPTSVTHPPRCSFPRPPLPILHHRCLSASAPLPVLHYPSSPLFIPPSLPMLPSSLLIPPSSVSRRCPSSRRRCSFPRPPLPILPSSLLVPILHCPSSVAHPPCCSSPVLQCPSSVIITSFPLSPAGWRITQVDTDEHIPMGGCSHTFNLHH